MTRRSISLSAADIGVEEQQLVQEVLLSGRLSNGPMLERLEREFAERFGGVHAVGVASGTAAIHLSLLSSGVVDGDLVITTPFSFIASANPILYERATPVFVDIDPQTFCIDPQKTVEAIVTLARRGAGWRELLPPKATSYGTLRAVIPVDVFGRVAEMRQIVACAREHGVAVVEDACEAVGASLDGIPAGRSGDLGAFSFFANKQMTAGEGGLVLTNNDHRARVIRSLRSQGRDDGQAWLRHQRVGYNYRLNELSAALGLAQLRRLDELLEKRRTVAALYDARLSAIEGVAPLPAARPGMNVSPFIYMIQFEEEWDRDHIATILAQHGIPTRPYFWPIHLQPAYRDRFGYEPGRYPHTERAGRSLLALPFHGSLSVDDVDYVCEMLAVALQSSSALASPGHPSGSR